MIQPVDILKLHDIKKTPGRISIIKSLQENGGPVSENQIKERMMDNYDRITFYRNIQTLTAAGIIHKIVVDNTHIRYGLNCCEEKHLHFERIHRNEHAHFYCEDCEKVVCLEEIRIPRFNLPEGFQGGDCDIIIKGKCEKCSR